MRKLVKLVLGNEFDITLAENGQQGYEAIQNDSFDVIISDVNMPIMNGLEFLEKLRAYPSSKFTPVLM